MAKRKGPGSYKPRSTFMHRARLFGDVPQEFNRHERRGQYKPRMIERWSVAFYLKPRKRA